MRAIYYNAKNEVLSTYENVLYMGYENEYGAFSQDTIHIRALVDGASKYVAFIRLGKGERVEYHHEYKKENTEGK